MHFAPKSIVAVCVLFFILLAEVNSSEKLGDPYKILGVDRRATTQEIRRAYKQLAKEW